MSSQLTGSVVLSTVVHTQDSMTPGKSLKRVLLNILDRAIVEMVTRFSRGNFDLMKAVNCLPPQAPSFLDVGIWGPLQKLTGSTGSDRLCNEILFTQVILENRFSSVGADLSTICKYLQEAAFPELHCLYITSLVIRVSFAACESSFG